MKDILFQLDICWQLFEYHINGLTDQEDVYKRQGISLGQTYIGLEYLKENEHVHSNAR